MNQDMHRVPVTILTGFLGAGKTTLLNRILRQRHGLKLAVIENEFGSESVDADILVQDTGEEIVQLDNGCLCCNIRGDLLRALAELERGRREGRLQFDRVVIETSGLADPGPVAQSLAADADAAAAFRLDAIVTVVDVMHGGATLAERAEARAQVAYADRIVLSKTQPGMSYEALEESLQRLNPSAPVLDLAGDLPLQSLLSPPHPDSPWVRAPAQAVHDSEVSSLTLVTHHPFDPQRLELFLAAAVDICGTDLYRCKGVLWVDGCDDKLVLQGVQLTMRVSAGERWASGSARRSKIVMIGRDLPVDELRDSLRRCLVSPGGELLETPGIAYQPVGTQSRGWLL